MSLAVRPAPALASFPAGPCPLARVADRLQLALEFHGLNVWRLQPPDAPDEVRLIVEASRPISIRRVDDPYFASPRVGVAYTLAGVPTYIEGGWHDPIRFLDFDGLAGALRREVLGI